MIADPFCTTCGAAMTWIGIGPGAQPECIPCLKKAENPFADEPTLPGGSQVWTCPYCGGHNTRWDRTVNDTMFGEYELIYCNHCQAHFTTL